jgi:hypothetical protein
MLHGVTLGGTGKERGDRHPKVRRGVLLGAGAKVLGNIEIGACAKIAAGSVVLEAGAGGLHGGWRAGAHHRLRRRAGTRDGDGLSDLTPCRTSFAAWRSTPGPSTPPRSRSPGRRPRGGFDAVELRRVDFERCARRGLATAG